jgi:hypothetical protein
MPVGKMRCPAFYTDPDQGFRINADPETRIKITADKETNTVLYLVCYVIYLKFL